MSESITDRLLQSTAPHPEWKAAASVARPAPPDFGDQLWQLTAPISARAAEPHAPPTPVATRSDDANAANRLGADRPSRSTEPTRDNTVSHQEKNHDAPTAPAADSRPSDDGCEPDDRVHRDPEHDKQDDHANGTAENAAAAAAGGSPQPAKDDALPSDAQDQSTAAAPAEAVPANDGEQAHKTTAKSAQHDPKGGRARAAAASGTQAADPNVTTVASGGAPVVAAGEKYADAAQQSSASAAAAAKDQKAVVETSSAEHATEQSGEVEGTTATAAQRRGKTSRNGAKAEATADQSIAEHPEATDAATVKVTAAATPAAKHARGGDKTADDDSSDDDGSRVHGKEANSRSAWHSAAAPDAQNLTVANIAANESSANADASGASSDDASPPAVRAAGSRIDNLQATLARGPRESQSAPAREGGESTQLSRVDTDRFVGRVARAFHFAQERGGTLQLRLSPPELGSLRMELTVKDGALTANLETETQAARRLLLDHLPALRERLAEQNVRVERFDVDVRRDGQGGQSSASGQQQAQQQHESQQPTPQRQRATKSPAIEAAPRPVAASTMVVNSSGINLVV